MTGSSGEGGLRQHVDVPAGQSTTGDRLRHDRSVDDMPREVFTKVCRAASV